MAGRDLFATEPTTGGRDLFADNTNKYKSTERSTIYTPRDEDAPTLGDFGSDVANVAASTAIGLPLAAAEQIGEIAKYAGEKIGLDTSEFALADKARESKAILVKEGLSPAGMKAGEAALHGMEFGVGGAGLFATAGKTSQFIGNMISKVAKVPKLTEIGLSKGVALKWAAAPARLIGRVLEDATVQVGKQARAQALAFGGASAAASGIEDDDMRLAAELVGSMSILGMSNASRLMFSERTAGKSQLGKVINAQEGPPAPDLIDGVSPTLANVTKNSNIKKTEEMVRGRDPIVNQHFQNIEAKNNEISAAYANELADQGVPNAARLEAIRAEQLQTVQSQIDETIELNAMLQQSANPLEAGVATDAALGKILDSAHSAASAMYNKIGNSLVKSSEMLKPIKDALNISNLDIKANTLYPKIETILNGIQSTITNKTSQAAINAKKQLLQEMKLARKANDFGKVKSIKESLAAMKKSGKKGTMDKTPNGMLSIEQLQGARSLLLQGIREAGATGSSDLARRYSIVLDSIETTLTKAEQAGNIDVTLLRAANEQYRGVKQIFGIGEISKAFQTTKAGANRYSLETLGQRFIKTNTQNGEETANQVVKAVNRYEEASGVGFAEAQDLMRTQFSAMISAKAASTASGRLSDGQLKAFVNSHSRSLKAYGIFDDFATMKAATASVDRNLSKLGRERSNFESKTYVSRLLNTDDPVGVVKTAIRNNSFSKMVAGVPNVADKDALRGMAIKTLTGDVENAFAGNKLQQALTNKDLIKGLGNMYPSMKKLADTVASLQTTGSGGVAILEARRALPVIQKKIERLGKRFFSVIRSVQNKVGITAFEKVLDNSTLLSHEILVRALENGKLAGELAKFAGDNPAAFRYMYSQAIAAATAKNELQENGE